MDAYLEQEICARIRTARKEAGFTQEDMAGLLDVTLRAYQNYEHDRVPFRRMGDIARLTNRPESWLLHGDPKPPPVSDLVLVRLLERVEGLEATLEDIREMLQALAPAPTENEQG